MEYGRPYHPFPVNHFPSVNRPLPHPASPRRGLPALGQKVEFLPLPQAPSSHPPIIIRHSSFVIRHSPWLDRYRSTIGTPPSRNAPRSFPARYAWCAGVDSSGSFTNSVTRTGRFPVCVA